VKSLPGPREWDLWLLDLRRGRKDFFPDASTAPADFLPSERGGEPDPLFRENPREVLRLVLGFYFGEQAGALSVGRAPGGKPVLKGRRDLRFSVSHSGVWWLAAFSGSRVGADVERIVPRPERDPVVATAFSENERALLEAQSEPGSRSVCFFRCWTRKEALLKLRGCGLKGLPEVGDWKGVWTWEDVPVPDLAVSVAALRRPEKVRFRIWPRERARGGLAFSAGGSV